MAYGGHMIKEPMKETYMEEKCQFKAIKEEQHRESIAPPPSRPCLLRLSWKSLRKTKTSRPEYLVL